MQNISLFNNSLNFYIYLGRQPILNNVTNLFNMIFKKYIVPAINNFFISANHYYTFFNQKTTLSRLFLLIPSISRLFDNIINDQKNQKIPNLLFLNAPLQPIPEIQNSNPINLENSFPHEVKGVVEVVQEVSETKCDSAKTNEAVLPPVDMYAQYLNYTDPKGIEWNAVKALECLQKGVIYEEPRALFEMGIFLLDGLPDLGIVQDEKKAFEIFKMDALKNHAGAAYQLHLCYLKGWGTKIDSINALKYLLHASENQYPEAMHDLGCFYLEGFPALDIAKDPSKGFDLVKSAAEQNDELALYHLYICYREGKGTGKDKSKAFTYLERSAATDNLKAKVELGASYLFGYSKIDIQKNKKKGFKILHEAAGLNSADAFYYLYVCYKDGKGVEIDIKRASKCFHYARMLKHPIAKSMLENRTPLFKRTKKNAKVFYQ